MKTFRLIARYCVNCGSNFKRLKGVKTEHYKIIANNINDAKNKLFKFNGRKETKSHTGYIFDITDKARVYHKSTITIN